ncbi:hypothetical protein ACIRD3_34275 [Kitasatospora sp. NPDC093550]|uniref:hypothetical protein n=1 Tax=Kitasatospora sp. NPDC093550 TaxID=3364089 RepID=UPI003826D9EA
MSDSPRPGGVVLDADELDARWAEAWRPEKVAQRLDGVGVTSCVAAGWALDQTRPHGDFEIAVPAAAFPEVRERFLEYVFDALGSAVVWPAAEAEGLAATHQTSARDPASGRFLFDVFREPHQGGTWTCRRDERLRLPYDTIIERTADGIPYLAPELVLPFKARRARPKDQADFDGVLPLLGRERRNLLGDWLTRVHPGHPWLAELAG